MTGAQTAWHRPGRRVSGLWARAPGEGGVITRRLDSAAYASLLAPGPRPLRNRTVFLPTWSNMKNNHFYGYSTPLLLQNYSDTITCHSTSKKNKETAIKWVIMPIIECLKQRGLIASSIQFGIKRQCESILFTTLFTNLDIIVKLKFR